jgi:preprotein translocase subunit YajC
MFISPAYAQTAGTGDGSFLIQLAPLILIFVVFYFLLIRPQQKKMKAHKAMVAGLRRGDRVVTAGGIIGVVTKVLNDTEAQLEIADGVRVRVVRATITDVLSKTAPADNAEEADLDEEAAAENGDKKARNRQIGGRGK